MTGDFAAQEPKSMEALARDKLELEIKRLVSECRDLERPPMTRPTTYIPIVVALIMLVGAFAKVKEATKKEEAAKIIVLVAKEAVAEANDSVAGAQANEMILEQKVAEANKKLEDHEIPVAGVRKISISFKGDLTRQKITALQALFQNEGILLPRPQRNGELTDSSVTYHVDTDAIFAETVRKNTSKFFAENGCVLTLPPAVLDKSGGKAGEIDMRIVHNCTGS